MMKASVLIPFIASLALPAMAQPASNPNPLLAPPLGSVWSIAVTGLKGEPLGTVTLELSGESARTCMSGNWNKARLLQSSFQSPDKQFETKDYFPTYETDGQAFTIQLNPPGLCDAYLFLRGKFTDREGRGDYYALGLGGGNPLGTFTAKRLR